MTIAHEVQQYVGTLVQQLPKLQALILRRKVGEIDRRLTVPAWVSTVIMRPVTALIRNSASMICR
jgi:hypothetical protein